MKPPTRQQAIRRRRRVFGTAAGSVVLAAALTSAFVWPGYADPAPSKLADTSATAPMTDAPTIDPAPRVAEQTDLTLAMPDVVGRYVQTKIAGSATWSGGDAAIESWQFTYADGDTPDANRILIDVGQWPNPGDAQEFFYDRTKPLAKPIAQGDLIVGKEKAGRYALVPDNAESGDAEQGTLYWRNGTVVFRAQGPLALLQQFYSAFPL